MEDALLNVCGLKTSFFTEAGELKAVDGVSFHVRKGQTLGLVGESGCGKSVTALSILRLVPSPPGQIVAGQVKFDGTDLLSLSEKQMRHIRGNRVSMIFQEPMTSLNPVFTIGNQIEEALKVHDKDNLSRVEIKNRVIESLKRVGIPDPELRLKDYPHQLSGGMRQRAMIAMALVCGPELLIADEPTTALDVTIQAQVLDLMGRLQTELNMSIMMITHDLGIIAEIAEDVAVMYAGKIVETCKTRRIFEHPLHPYTIALLQSRPAVQVGKEKNQEGKRPRLRAISGTVPSLTELPPGCHFNDRCPWVVQLCREAEPTLAELEPGHFVSCWKAKP